jgi:hypothetical protein
MGFHHTTWQDAYTVPYVYNTPKMERIGYRTVTNRGLDRGLLIYSAPDPIQFPCADFYCVLKRSLIGGLTSAKYGVRLYSRVLFAGILLTNMLHSPIDK